MSLVKPSEPSCEPPSLPVMPYFGDQYRVPEDPLVSEVEHHQQSAVSVGVEQHMYRGNSAHETGNSSQAYFGYNEPNYSYDYYSCGEESQSFKAVNLDPTSTGDYSNSSDTLVDNNYANYGQVGPSYAQHQHSGQHPQTEQSTCYYAPEAYTQSHDYHLSGIESNIPYSPSLTSPTFTDPLYPQSFLLK